MTEKQEKYLELAVIEQLKFDKISEVLNVDRKVVSDWWNDLKEPREYLSYLRNIWKTKFKNIENKESFWEFKKWYEESNKECYYCGITDSQLQELHNSGKELTKRNRGKKLEIERLEPNEPYENIENLVFSCYWCNNAKTDTFSPEEFKGIGKEIGKTWKKRLQK